MSRIALMPEELANQIAAGEVVERPASVVKELVENSLDAGAQRVDVDIESGGLALVRITDDGTGMTQEEAELCLLRHATSKLRCAEDLFRLQTMGFRGEAMASIASVSRLTLTTRTKDAVAAYRITTEAGQKKSPSREVGGSVGTQIEVRDLFFNVPARLKFMKTESTESGHIAETLVRLALAFPGVHFKLRHKGKVTLDLPPHRSPVERSRAALASRGKGAGVPTLYLAQASGDGISIEAHLGAPEDATSTPRNVFLLINHRFVRDRSLLHAAQAGYGELLERGRYPLLVLHLHLDAATVDVNVHPQKLEVRMASADTVYSLVRTALRNLCVQAPWLVGIAAPAQKYVVGGSGFAQEARPTYGGEGGPGDPSAAAEHALPGVAPGQGFAGTGYTVTGTGQGLAGAGAGQGLAGTGQGLAGTGQGLAGPGAGQGLTGTGTGQGLAGPGAGQGLAGTGAGPGLAGTGYTVSRTRSGQAFPRTGAEPAADAALGQHSGAEPLDSRLQSGDRPRWQPPRSSSSGASAEHQLPLQPQWGAGLAEHRARLRQAVELYAPTAAGAPGAAEPPGERSPGSRLPTDAADPGTLTDPDAAADPAARAGEAADGPRAGSEPATRPEGEPERAAAVLRGLPAEAALTGVTRLTLAALKYLGQLLGTYLLCEGDGELLLIDQHAAHERVVYERLRRAHAEQPLTAQRLLFPASLELDERRAALLTEHADTLTQLGFEVRPFGGRSFALCAAPDLGAYGRGAQVHRDPERLLRQVLDELEEGGRSDTLRERSDLLLATMACHAAVRAGDPMDPAKALALLRAMDEVDYSPYCPHGRPVLIRLNRTEIERRFGRA